MSTARHPARTVAFAVTGVLAIAVAVLGYLWWDDKRTTKSAEDLVAVTEDSEAALAGFNAAAEQHLDVLDGAAPQGQMISEYDRQVANETFARSVGESASEALGEVLVQAHEAESLDLRAGSDLDEARDAYVAHIEAWETDLRAYADGDLTGVGSADVSATFRIAEQEFDDLDLPPSLRARVETLFAD